jgi:glycosyltransferase involved in cell wall biosynthesis
MLINYSFIIPHRNIFTLLSRCIDSIPRRNDIEIIIVDDYSEYIDVFPGENDPYIRIIYLKEHKGAGYARNLGMSKSLGKWLFFVDADDMLNPCFFKVVDTYLNSDLDVIYFDTNGVYSKSLRSSYRTNTFSDKLNNAIHKKDINLFYYSIFRPWAKMFSRKFIFENNIKFDETFVNNDRMFTIKTVFYAKSITYNFEKIYTSFDRENSLVKMKNIEYELQRIIVDCEVNTFLIKNNKSVYCIDIFHSLMSGTIRAGLTVLLRGFPIILSDYHLKISFLNIFHYLYLIPNRIMINILINFNRKL